MFVNDENMRLEERDQKEGNGNLHIIILRSREFDMFNIRYASS